MSETFFNRLGFGTSATAACGDPTAYRLPNERVCSSPVDGCASPENPVSLAGTETAAW
jgi:hypothetical protein